MKADSGHLHAARILIVDDKPANTALLKAILEDEDYQNFWIVNDPREVRELYQKWRHDIILLDIRMPYLDGFDVMEQLAEITGDNDYLPVLVLTAQTDMDTRVRALAAGAMDFINKPFDKVEVVHRVRNMLLVRDVHKQQRWQAEILEAEVRKRTQELFNTRMEIIHRLGRAGEYRDNETGAHVIRISLMSDLLAEVAGCDRDMCELIRHASPMHDVGKIGIPDRILLKPGRLEADEWEIMKTHSAIGGEILSGSESEIVMFAKTIALTHHEKWDGTGYPEGLSGENIPLEGRIVALCDVFDALLSERPYKNAWPLEQVMAYIKDQADRQFDPALVPLFEVILPEIIEIRSAHSDEPEPEKSDSRGEAKPEKLPAREARLAG